ncbi:MAG: OmpA family protein [Treponema sp.]
MAEILLEANGAMLLVEGHSASTGNKKGELELSKERAAVIAKELSNRGIDSSRFILKGCGSDHPIADNSTKDGMAQNRRVEITILE